MYSVALTIAGSDSGGSSGVQADLKSFSALGVYGCTAITAITAQNTSGITGIVPAEPMIIERQIRAILEDMRPAAIKIGVVYTKPIVNRVYHSLKQCNIPIVLDPIISATTGKQLLRSDAFKDFKSQLIPISTVVTANRLEAESLTGRRIFSLKNATEALYDIQAMGARNVVLKGGHFRGKYATDTVLDHKGDIFNIQNLRFNMEKSHGLGCNFSAALTAFLAKKLEFIYSCKMANSYINNALRKTKRIGNGLVVIDPLSEVYGDADRYNVYRMLQLAVKEIEAISNFGRLIPETQSNIVYATFQPRGISDIMGVKGRIAKFGEMAKTTSVLEFGASTHVASAVLEYMNHNPVMRSAMNIKFDQRIMKTCKRLFLTSYFDRREEPKGVKDIEGRSISWGIKQALSRLADAEIIYHTGAIGKEPMVLVFSSTPVGVVKKVKKVLRNC